MSMLETLLRHPALGLAVLSICLEGVKASEPFTLKQNHSGSNFLDNWTFYNGPDPDSYGNVLYQTKEQAQQEQLTFLNSAGNFIIKVDNTTDGRMDQNFGRASVRMLSSYTISTGSLVLFDALHMPFGCSVWPAFWTRGQTWPEDGEVDIIEAVNLMSQNQVSLHTLDGCKHPDNASSSSIETGQLISTDCFNQTNGNQGCIVQVPGQSFGESFSSSGGGVYALNWNSSGLYMWFFPRSSIPSDLPTVNPNPDGWGLPTAAYPTSSCDASKFFGPQNLILNINICGAYAGAPNVFGASCSGQCLDLVQTPDNYDNAYFEISYIRVFEQGGSETASGTNGVASATKAGAAGQASQTATSSSSSAAGAKQGNFAEWTSIFFSVIGLCMIAF